MGKKQNQHTERVPENYYDLKVDKVEELVAILKGESFEDETPLSMNISDCTGVNDPKNYKRNGKQKQFNPYRLDLLSRIPHWITAIFIKWWFAGAVCYFIMFGIQTVDDLDKFVICGIALGVVVDMMVNPIFVFMETGKHEYNKFIMFPFPFRAFWTFFANIIYYICVLLVVVLINYGVNVSTGKIGIEPLLFATYTLVADMAFIGVKDLLVFVFKKFHKKKIVENV